MTEVIKKKIKNFNFVVIGGGTGTFSVLSGLKNYTDKITAIVNMADSGGSAKKERDEWGLLPSSDLRKSIIALADISQKDSVILRKLFQYRYSEGAGLEGMTFGNLFLIALTRLLGSQQKAILKASKLLHIKGKVLPVTYEKIDLVATYSNGQSVIGEHFIDDPKHDGKLTITKLATIPDAQINPDAKEAILNADAIILGPGGFYTTILANLVISGVREAIIKSRAVKIYILNLMTEYGQTYGFSAAKFIDKLNGYLPVNKLDYVLLNSAPIPQRILNRYQEYQANPVKNDLDAKYPFKVISADLLSAKPVKKEKGDMLKRSFIRHSPEKIALECMKIVNLL